MEDPRDASEGEVAGRRRVVAHLVHGTWPKGGVLANRFPRVHAFLARRDRSRSASPPSWYEEGSEFRSALASEVPGIEWRPFLWSGANLEVERRKAARDFAATLKAEVGAADDACHVVVAHSHGGNVALWALGELDPPTRDRVAGLATMGTPFLHFAPRRLSPLEARYLRLMLGGRFLIGVLIVTLLLLGATWLAGGWTGSTWDGATWAQVAIVGLGVAWGVLRARRRRRRAPDLGRQPTCPDRLASFVAFRSRGDEASKVIAVADIGLSALTHGWSIVKRCARWMPWDDRAWRRKVWRVVAVLLLVLSPATVAYWAFGPPREVLAGMSTWARVGAVALVPVCFALMTALLLLSAAFVPLSLANMVVSYSQVFLALAFGSDTASLAVATEIAAEPSPPQPAPLLVQVDPGDAESRHSLHAIPAARARIAEWIRERRAAPPCAPA